MERVKTNENLKITKKRIIDYLETMADEDGQLPINFGEDNSSNRSDEYMKDAADCTISENNDSKIATIKSKTKLISINDLLKEGLVEEGDNWRLQYKGETFWARVTGNGDLEVNGNIFPNPSRAAASVIHRQSAGWNRWFYKDSEGLWFEVENLRAIFREKHGFNAIRRSRNIEKIAS